MVIRAANVAGSKGASTELVPPEIVTPSTLATNVSLSSKSEKINVPVSEIVAALSVGS